MRGTVPKTGMGEGDEAPAKGGMTTTSRKIKERDRGGISEGERGKNEREEIKRARGRGFFGLSTRW